MHLCVIINNVGLTIYDNLYKVHGNKGHSSSSLYQYVVTTMRRSAQEIPEYLLDHTSVRIR